MEFLQAVEERFPTDSDKRRACDKLFNKKNDLHVCDLDLALLFILLSMYSGYSIPCFFDERKDLLKALVDSSFAKLLAPEQFKTDVVTVDDEKRFQEVSESIVNNLICRKVAYNCLDMIGEHELLNPIDVTLLGIVKSNVVNSFNNVQIQIKSNDVYSFSLSQTGFSVIDEIILLNTGDKEIKNAKLVISSDPNYIEFSDVDIPLLNPHQPVSISDFAKNPHLEELANIIENEVGMITVRLFSEDKELVSLTKKMDFCPFNTYLEYALNGSTALFVTPNDIAVKNVISRTGTEMYKLTGEPSIDGYLSGNKEKIVTLLKALYNTLFESGIAYIIAPASFNSIANFGQKIRLPHEVLTYKQGTCLDLSILFASCIENMGLNPVVVLIKGHAFAGAFLEDLRLPTTIFADATKILEMCSEEENELILFECTSITAGNKTSFEEACVYGKDNLLNAISDPKTGKADPEFEVIDIKRARSNGFFPLPIQYDDNVSRIVVDYEVEKQNKERFARKKYDYKGDKLKLTDAEINKFDVWEKKLLDLSKRNQLINYRINGRGLQIYYYDLNDLFDAFKNCGKKYSLCAYESKQDFSFELLEATQETYDELKRDFNNGTIGLLYKYQSQRTSLRFFENERKKSFEETGSNILYLALGFIRYFESERSERALYAPIVLVPIDLIKHSKDNYSICGREEPPFLNISIFEFFHQEYGMNFDDLLTMDLFNDDEVDIDSILNTVSEKIKKLNRSCVIRTAAINIFNFSKAVMWSDVKFRREELLKNKTIKSIINKKYIYDETDEIDDTFDDDNSDPTELAIPLPADSSQIVAIKACANGNSFILEGPPGTGKSQTITNMIVNAIYHGKTVLFVAEKMAALNVVRKRLNQLCLGNFALEAHSTKADKASLMSQFEDRVALNRTISSSEEYLTTANKIKSERIELNRVINLLHKENKFFISFYEALVNYLDLDEEVQTIEMDNNYVANLNLLDFSEASRLCNELYSLIVSNGGYINNPFFFYRNEKYVPGVTKSELSIKLKEYKSLITEYIGVLEYFNTLNSMSISDDPNKCAALNAVLLDEKIADQTLINILDIDFDSVDSHINYICDKGKTLQKDIIELRSNYLDSIFEVDAEKALVEYNALSDASFLTKTFGLGKIIKTINTSSKTGKSCDKHNLLKTLSLIKESKLLENELHDKMKRFQIIFGSFNGVNIRDYDFNDFSIKYEYTKSLVRKYAYILGINTIKSIVIKTQSFSLKYKNEITSSFERLSSIESTLSKDFKFDFVNRDKQKVSYNNMLSIIDKMLFRIDYLSNWCALLNSLNECKKRNIDSIIKLVESQEDIQDNLELIYKKSVYSHIILKSIQGDEKGSFNSVELKHHIDYYKDLLENFKELTIKETAARVSARMPSIKDNSPASSQQGILNKAIKNKCRGKSIRQLFFEVSDILTKIFPVFLMSPMSCAQYLSPNMPKFDIVIFDEASQMPTSEAIGAIARGNSLIVVGDTKQMPPTAFFQSKGLEDLDSDLDDLESILDDCSGIMMPSKSLTWHYRSKHESLIRFSNAKFYKNNLVTFPSPNDMTSKVSFINTKGVYGGKKSTNEIEAKAVIKEVERRLKSPELRKKSIGIVTFSSSQQETIDDLLQDFFSKHKDLEKINLESKEPIIVKNLENIQGDERDVILFSICYGPDKNGSMYYRFGPINNKGGEKRLNVAVSRARYEMIVFTSFEPEVLASMKTESTGAKELYNFLRYAKYGDSALITPNGSALENKVGIEKNIAEKLIERGYKATVDVGKSSFRVDIGIVNPDNKNEYILGVLCDSYSYQSTATSRDRNVVQPTALELLGWNLMRVWSFDYLDNPEKVIDSICDKVEDIRSHPELYKTSIEANHQMEITFESKDVETLNFSKTYTPYSKVYNIYGTGDDNSYVKRQIVQEIMEMEAPISKEVLQNRFANAIGVSRAGSNIQTDMLYALRSIGAKKNTCYQDKSKIFFWLPSQSQELEFYRVGGEKPRSMNDVPKEEIFVAVKETLLNYGPMFKEELKGYVAKAFDIKAMGSKVDKAIEDCIEFYKYKELLVMVDNESRVALKSQEKK